MNVTRPQPAPHRHRPAVTPFVPFQPFQIRVTKRDQRCQKVPAGELRPFHSEVRCSAGVPACGFAGRPARCVFGTGELDAATIANYKTPMENPRGILTVNENVNALSL